MAIIKNTYDTVSQVFQDIIDPQLEGLKGEITALRAEVRRVDSRIDTLEKRVEEGLNTVRGEVASLEKRTAEGLAALEKRMEEGLAAVRTEISYTNRRLDEVLEIRERLAALEAKVAVR